MSAAAEPHADFSGVCGSAARREILYSFSPRSRIVSPSRTPSTCRTVADTPSRSLSCAPGFADQLLRQAEHAQRPPWKNSMSLYTRFKSAIAVRLFVSNITRLISADRAPLSISAAAMRKVSGVAFA